jgi:hypothetical protein
MAGAGKKTFTAGEILTASDTNTYLMEQTVMYFAGTAARASAIPTPSTGMTSYIGVTGTATIPQLETYTGSAWQTPYGLTQVANVSFTSATTLNLDNLFTSTYANYRILMTVTNTASTYGYVTWQSRNGGTTDTSSATFEVNGTLSQLAVVNFVYQAGQTAGRMGLSSGTGNVGGFTQMEIMSPALATYTGFSGLSNGVSGSYFAALSVAGVKSTAAAHDGITFNFPASSSGAIRVYGYRNS